ncbi:PspC domain-containing protein [Pedobacter deserti]|uniref:PspC domain-containing protein n=1 Tax=Pedobacter deserti TaxID=2817382 RepID=UPI002109292E|nr:PspC domain-containing protein [Pedobacter sp. SYSU D00382]
MKKTFNINIGNSIIQIEEDAYEMLVAYMNEIKQHFARTAEDFEIVTDIENRIAEMLHENLSSGQKQAIGIDDIRSVMERMGSVSDFEHSAEAEFAGPRAGSAYAFSVKKLFRNTDQAVIAGVCSGLGHYLDVDVRWVRVAAFLSIFAGGLGILTYVILWIMVPKAETRVEKMSMKGMEANLRGFASSNFDPFFKQSKGSLSEMMDFVSGALSKLFRFVFKLAAVLIIAWASLALIGLMVGTVALMGFWDTQASGYFPFNIVNDSYFSPLLISAFIVASIPLLALLLFSLRVAFTKRPVNRTLSFVLLIIWLCGVAPLAYYITRISSEFKEGAEFAEVGELKPYPVYTLKMDRTRYFTAADSLRYKIDRKNYKDRKILNDIDHEFESPRNVRIWIEKSDNDKASVTRNFKARGLDFETALINARNIHYDFSQTDSVVNLGHSIHLSKGSNWRGQEVELIVRLPVGTRLNLHKDFHRYLSGNLYWDCDEGNDEHHVHELEYFELLMTANGLQCVHPKPTEPED